MKSSLVNQRNIHNFVNGLAESFRRLDEDTMRLELARIDIARLAAIISIVPSDQETHEDPLFRGFLDLTAGHLIGAPNAPIGFTPPNDLYERTILSGHMLLVQFAVEVVKSRQRVREQSSSFVDDTPLVPTALAENDRTPVPS